MKHRVLWVDTLFVRNLCADMNINTCHEYINPYREYIFLSNSDVIKTNFNFQITNQFRPKDSASKRCTRCWQAIADSHTPASGRNELQMHRVRAFAIW